MDLLQAIQERRSVRKFSPEPVGREDITRILEGARWAPSGSNQQPWRFTVIRRRTHIEQMAEVVRRKIDERARDESLDRHTRVWLRALRPVLTFFAGAPVVIAALSTPY